MKRAVWIVPAVVLYRARLPLAVFAMEFAVAVAEALEDRRNRGGA